MATPEQAPRDPALDPHIHHANKSNDPAAYTVSTTMDPPQSPHSEQGDFEKDVIPSAPDEEKGSRKSNEAAVEENPPAKKSSFSRFYRRYKVFFHTFYFVFFTA